VKRPLLVIGVLWACILFGLVGIKEFTLRTGQVVLLKTVPVDPRDLFRGDYVILAYEIGALDPRLLGAGQAKFAQGQDIYVELVAQGPYSVAGPISHACPRRGQFIKGRVKTTWGERLAVEYGIESYFVPEGKGSELQREVGKTLDVKVAVDRFGNAAIKSLMPSEREASSS